MTVHRNVGGTDKTFRIVLGLVLLGVVLFAEMKPIWMAVTLVVSAIALVTAFTAFCPLNFLLGINTRRTTPDAGERNVP
ncbi:MAG: YgaP family membrane protein [Nitrospiraceae bacterium]